MDTYAPEAPRTDLAINAWASVHLFADVLAGLDTIDAASLTAALDGYQVDLDGLAPPFTLGVPDNQLDLPSDLHGHVPGARGVGRRNRAVRGRRVPGRERLRGGVTP